MTELLRLERLVALLALAFCWCQKIGEWLHAQKQLKLKKHGRKPKSLFRCGFAQLRRMLLNFAHFDLQAWHCFIDLLIFK